MGMLAKAWGSVDGDPNPYALTASLPHRPSPISVERMIVKIGCCGFPVAMRTYSSRMKLVEVQSTFYNPPSKRSIEGWLRNSPKDFEFSVKAWMAITHPTDSPVWRRSKAKLPGDPANYGLFKPTEENMWAWEKTLEICEALRARVCVLQTPPRFNASKANIENMADFFSSVDRGDLEMAWEPRGDWKGRREEVRDVCERLGLIPIVDILRHEPIPIGPILYTRLHGLGEREYNYGYRYTDEDLSELFDKVSSLRESNVSEVYVLFNNIHMFDDALRFMRLFGDGR
jgi:uncharacterized protein YecE (DUF72 family)